MPDQIETIKRLSREAWEAHLAACQRVAEAQEGSDEERDARAVSHIECGVAIVLADALSVSDANRIYYLRSPLNNADRIALERYDAAMAETGS